MNQSWWTDPESAWWAKADCAKRHIDTLAGQARDLLEAGSFRLTAEQDSAGVTAYRLNMSQPVPISFSTTMGDALHDLRSALDCAASAIARRHVGRDLCEDEERDCEFPICKKRSELTKWFKQGLRQTLFGQREQQAIRRLQPAAMHDELEARRQTPVHPRGDEVEYDRLYLLQRLSNIDKHRRLHVVTIKPGLLVYWGSDEPSKRQWQWGTPPFADGAILGYLIDDPQHPELLPDLQSDFELRLTGPRGAAETDVVRLLEGIHQYVTGWVLPRVLNP